MHWTPSATNWPGSREACVTNWPPLAVTAIGMWGYTPVIMGCCNGKNQLNIGVDTTLDFV